MIPIRNRVHGMRQTSWLRAGCCLLAGSLLVVAARGVEPNALQLSDMGRAGKLTSTQGWGSLGLDTGVVPAGGRTPSPIRIGDKTYSRGLGHHATGEIRVPLAPQHRRFRAEGGVLWQGGNRGSTVLQVWVDDEKRFDSGVLTDSSAPLPIDVNVAGGRVLRLVAADGGDGIACDCPVWANARLLIDTNVPVFGTPELRVGGRVVPRTDSVCGLAVAVAAEGAPVVLFDEPDTMLACVPAEESVTIHVPVSSRSALTVMTRVRLRGGDAAEVVLACGDAETRLTLDDASQHTLTLKAPSLPEGSHVTLTSRGTGGASEVLWSGTRVRIAEDIDWALPIVPDPPDWGDGPVATMPALPTGAERQLIEWDWRMQDGIGTTREPVSYQTASARILDRGMRMLKHLADEGTAVEPWLSQGRLLTGTRALLAEESTTDTNRWEELWRHVHLWRRAAMFGAAWPDRAPVAFVKRVPSSFSHQLTQYYGSCARPGGGIFVLDNPGGSMRCRALVAEELPPGSYQHLGAHWDATRLLFAYCEAPTVPENREQHQDRVYHLYEVRTEGGELSQLTDGPYDDFAPRYLPDGDLLFLSTRRGGYHRCGRGPCPVYTLARAHADGSEPRTISFHETNEWDPALMADGRVVYTRWDYVDRSAVYYQQLWSVRPDGTDVRILFGNNTFNPVGIWEARAIPGSHCLLATAGAHHAMTAGSIIRLDPSAGVDGLEPITRLTPDALFPESEIPVAPRNWHGGAGVTTPPTLPEEARRWPGHCYRSPFPLSETLFLAAYSFAPLMGEPAANQANMFGLYLVDAFGNKELLHRDLNISSLWPVVLAQRQAPPRIPSVSATAPGATSDSPESEPREGTFFMANVYAADPPLPDEPICRLRILQVLPKSTPHANTPRVGLANASPGKQVLGTVPVEADGSAYFRAPARTPLMFQALDEKGRAVQTMRSLTYLQPGEDASCVGCHEPRLATAPPAKRQVPQALERAPSSIAPGPNGSCPLSYPLLVQPVLDRHCVRCHNSEKPKGKIVLTNDPEGAFTRSYHALAPRVSYPEWKGGDFRKTNGEPLTQPDRFGARGSRLMTMLEKGHHGVNLPAEDLTRLVIWMDANALFYGTFNPADQAAQRRGERIAGPDVQ